MLPPTPLHICRTFLRRARFSTEARNNNYFFNGPAIPDNSLFSFHPYFFTEAEQKILLRSSLRKLDSTSSRLNRRRRRLLSDQTNSASLPTSNLFLPDDLYEFHEGHYDGVIHGYREMHVTSWASEDVDELNPLLTRLKGLVPDVKMQTHILHLSSLGEILPHIDNLDASGSWILGVSLGFPRVLRLEKTDSPSEYCDVLLPSGSVYVQRDNIRFEYMHSILKDEVFRGEVKTGGQRLSVMLRDLK